MRWNEVIKSMGVGGEKVEELNSGYFRIKLQGKDKELVNKIVKEWLVGEEEN